MVLFYCLALPRFASVNLGHGEPPMSEGVTRFGDALAGQAAPAEERLLWH